MVNTSVMAERVLSGSTIRSNGEKSKDVMVAILAKGTDITILFILENT